MNFLEKDLETIIYETPNEILQERGLNISGRKKRQVRIGNYGIADMITLEKSIPSLMNGDYNFFRPDSTEIIIYELKQNKISVNAFLQSLRYMKGVDMYLKSRNFNDYTIKLVLIGKEIELQSSIIYLTDYFVDSNANPILKFYTYIYEINGLKFIEHENYSLTNDGFKTPKPF